ncbi:MAG: hypothetical protein US15_C0012G0013 [Candidatus Moranbacteria bacterium GW2011_GWF1_36_4]|nr:MAG: hypothetical protein US15_C0012G0013 [Candidatus Moranbacteria bacterium GW2011_GWF1_36_4]HBD94271.1 hypothetical protein [Spirochaetia bacterium]
MKTNFITNKEFESIGTIEFMYLNKDVRAAIISDAISFINEAPFRTGSEVNELSFSIYETEIDFYDGCPQALPKKAEIFIEGIENNKYFSYEKAQIAARIALGTPNERNLWIKRGDDQCHRIDRHYSIVQQIVKIKLDENIK